MEKCKHKYIDAYLEWINEKNKIICSGNGKVCLKCGKLHRDTEYARMLLNGHITTPDVNKQFPHYVGFVVGNPQVGTCAKSEIAIPYDEYKEKYGKLKSLTDVVIDGVKIYDTVKDLQNRSKEQHHETIECNGYYVNNFYLDKKTELMYAYINLISYKWNKYRIEYDLFSYNKKDNSLQFVNSGYEESIDEFEKRFDKNKHPLNNAVVLM